MKSIIRTFSALVFTGSIFAAGSAFAITPFQAATLAHRGQLKGIPSYETLELRVSTGQVTGEDILRAAGADVNAADAALVETFVHDYDNNR